MRSLTLLIICSLAPVPFHEILVAFSAQFGLQTDIFLFSWIHRRDLYCAVACYISTLTIIGTIVQSVSPNLKETSTPITAQSPESIMPTQSFCGGSWKATGLNVSSRTHS
ncbi:hypothetical protein BJV78DRAFT_833545 [Lactifluus subvellereus]|nr:hypothetical protein BJV78DRAFT_833545 [Lactifluus subvellereus]